MVVCPDCQRNDSIQRASALHSAGTSNSSGTYSSSSQVSGTYSGQNQTQIARQAAPPSLRIETVGLACRVFGQSFGFLLFAPFILNVFLYLMGYTDGIDISIITKLLDSLVGPDDIVQWFVITATLAAVLAAISIPFGIRNARWNKTKGYISIRQWQATWYCHRCDTFFTSI